MIADTLEFPNVSNVGTGSAWYVPVTKPWLPCVSGVNAPAEPLHPEPTLGTGVPATSTSK
jgi:hypothetical protein